MDKDSKMNPRTERAREALMDAAFELSSTMPTADISLTQIAEAAGVTRPTVYKLFEDVPTLIAITTEKFIGEALGGVESEIKGMGLDDRQYFDALMQGFVERVYAQREFARNVMSGPAAAKCSVYVIRLLDGRMRDRRVGARLGAGQTADDFRAAISAGVVWMLTVWLQSDFRGCNEPGEMARRLSATLFELSGI